VLELGMHNLSVFFAADDNYEAVSSQVVIKVLEVMVLSEKLEQAISIFPNPIMDNMLHVRVPFKSNHAKLHLYSLSGQKVLSQRLENDENTIDVTDIPKGVYILKVFSENETQISKIIKE
jgi:hypothetical protein